jgi:hypothetical protein
MNLGGKDAGTNGSAHYFKELVVLCEKQSFQVSAYDKMRAATSMSNRRVFLKKRQFDVSIPSMQNFFLRLPPSLFLKFICSLLALCLAVFDMVKARHACCYKDTKGLLFAYFRIRLLAFAVLFIIGGLEE